MAPRAYSTSYFFGTRIEVTEETEVSHVRARARSILGLRLTTKSPRESGDKAPVSTCPPRAVRGIDLPTIDQGRYTWWPGRGRDAAGTSYKVEGAMPNPSKKMERKPPVEFTPERKLVYLRELRRTGLVYLSAELAGVTRWTVQDHQKRDPEFGQQHEEAKQYWVDTVLVKEAVRRAIEGVEEPIVGGKFKDEIVTHVRRYSDGLLTTLLRANRSEFRDGKSEAGSGGGSSPVMFIPAVVPNTMDDWENMYGEAALGKGGRE